MSDQFNSECANEVQVYIHAISGGPKGPYAWCARVKDGADIMELGGVSPEDHFTRLQVVGAIQALAHIRGGANVHLVCADKYLVQYVLRSSLPCVEEQSKMKGLKNLDLFPAMRAAVVILGGVRGTVVRVESSDEDHMKAADGAKRRRDAARLVPVMPVKAIKARQPPIVIEQGIPW